jgi:parallel beta-helix repeat protein
MDKRYGILVVIVTILVLCFAGTASAGTLYVDDDGGADFTGIQEAINTASVGDTIIVHSGVYYENVVVDKSVTLIGNGHPVVDAGGKEDAIALWADGITLVGFTATNSESSWGCAGIKVISSNNTITGNNVRNNWNGICLDNSSNNTITWNNASSNDGGIFLRESSNNTITGNTFLNDGFRVSYSYQNTVKDNTVNGKPLVYLEDVSDYKVEDAGQVILVNCNNITVENLDLSDTSEGIELWETEDSKVVNNTVCNNNGDGISLYESSNNNTITGNDVCNNRNGICLDNSSNNTITGNNVCSNDDGIHLFLSCNNNNIITGNNVSNNNYNGICLFDSSNNTITGNDVSNNKDCGIAFGGSNNTITGNTFVNDGLRVSYSYQNTVKDNTVNGKPLVYLEDVSDYKVKDAGQVIIVNCNNITIENLDLSNTDVGIELWKTENSKISNNTVCNNNWGGIRPPRGFQQQQHNYRQQCQQQQLGHRPLLFQQQQNLLQQLHKQHL